MSPLLDTAHAALSRPRAFQAFLGLVNRRGGAKAFIDEYVRPAAGEHVLDIACGPGLKYPLLGDVRYTGFDENPDYIAAARRRFGSGAAFFCARISDARPRDAGSYDLVLALGILHHLDDTDASELVQLAAHVLRPGGRLVTLDNAFVKGQSRLARWLIERDRGRHVRTPEAYASIAATAFRTVDTVVRHDLLRVPYTHVILTCRL